MSPLLAVLPLKQVKPPLKPAFVPTALVCQVVAEKRIIDHMQETSDSMVVVINELWH